MASCNIPTRVSQGGLLYLRRISLRTSSCWPRGLKITRARHDWDPTSVGRVVQPHARRLRAQVRLQEQSYTYFSADVAPSEHDIRRSSFVPLPYSSLTIFSPIESNSELEENGIRYISKHWQNTSQVFSLFVGRRIARKCKQFRVYTSLIYLNRKFWLVRKLGWAKDDTFPSQITFESRYFPTGSFSERESPTLPRAITRTRVRGPRYVSWRSSIEKIVSPSVFFFLSRALPYVGRSKWKVYPDGVRYTDITHHQLRATNRSLAGNYADYTRFLWLQREPTGLRATLVLTQMRHEKGTGAKYTRHSIIR